MLSIIAKFEARPGPVEIREGMAIAKAQDRLPGRQPKLSHSQEAHLVELRRAGQHTTELAELFNIAHSTAYRAIQRASSTPPNAAGHSSLVLKSPTLPTTTPVTTGDDLHGLVDQLDEEAVCPQSASYAGDCPGSGPCIPTEVAWPSALPRACAANSASTSGDR
jgi:hypothetical protein